MVDPMTSNGVTAALRHAAEASRLIIRFRDRSTYSTPAGFHVQPARVESCKVFQQRD